LSRISSLVELTAVAGGSGSSAVIDLYTRRVPNVLTLGLAASGLLSAAFGLTRVGIGGALAGFVVGLALMLPGHLLGATGAGDVKLLAALGVWLGPARTGQAFFYTALAGGVLAVLVAIRRRRLAETMGRTAELVRSGGGNLAEIEAGSSDNRFAYAPAIAVGAIVVALGF
jgi:prepilin peptidase CpaA